MGTPVGAGVMRVAVSTERLNLYADRGGLVLAQRCRQRAIVFG